MSEEPIAFYHFRNRDDHEVDIVLQGMARVVGVEVKLSATVGSCDFQGLKKLQEVTGDRFVCGVVLYDGRRTAIWMAELA